MDFRTQLPPSESPFQLQYQDTILSMGSCFAEHIGQRLSDHKFGLHLNPFGILYNPLSLIDALYFLASDDEIEEDDLFQHQDLWHHFSFHGRFSHPDRTTALEQMRSSIRKIRSEWPKINRVMLTFGTAYAFQNKQTGAFVANCHKLPGSAFERVRLPAEDFIFNYLNLLEEWKALQPDLQVLISVSPMRHIRDGLVENQRSKAILVLAADELVKALEFVHYFPAYELVLDDLRDYRFYAKDLIHPNEMAVDYVWEFFKASCITKDTLEIYDKVQSILQAARHRPFHENTAGHRKFCERQLSQIAELEGKYSWLDLSKEKDYFIQSIP
ncbi:MAG: GSCFA domain-containing protein [Saprospiraceae bacterium]|nr:GSCFA domain-containing protein [Lewinella sp.]